MSAPGIHTIFDVPTALPKEVQELCLTFSPEQDRLHLYVALASLEGGSRLFEELDLRDLKKGRDWAFLEEWKRQNGSLPTISSLNRVQRLCLDLFCWRAKDRIDCIHMGYTEAIKQHVKTFTFERSQTSTLSDDFQPLNSLELDSRLKNQIRPLLSIRGSWHALSEQGRSVLTEYHRSVLGTMAVTALGGYSRNAPREQRTYLSRRDATSWRAHPHWIIPHCQAMTAALLVGDVLLTQHKTNPASLPLLLDRLFEGEENLHTFLAQFLPPPYLTEDKRNTLLNSLDLEMLRKYLPWVLPTMFVILGTGRERRDLVEKFFMWAEQNVQRHPLAISHLASALVENMTELTDEWHPKCLPFVEAPFRPQEYLALEQDRFAEQAPLFRSLEEQRFIPVPLLTALVSANYLEALRGLLKWERASGRELLIHYRALTVAITESVSEATDIYPSKQLIETLADAVDLASLTTRIFRPRSRERVTDFPDLDAVRRQEVKLDLQREAAIHCVLVKKIAENPRLFAEKYAHARLAINEILPKVNAMIAHLASHEDEGIQALLPEGPIEPLPAPSGLQRIYSWLRYTVWPTAKLASKVFAREITSFPRDVWNQIRPNSGIRLVDRVTLVCFCALVAAVFYYYFVICTTILLLWTAFVSWKNVKLIQDGELRLEDVG